ncbi:MAG: AEC family transporter [Bacillaceae bacterium]|nr:AEC family transporter [Bacillaceae bacterium]
MFFQVIMPVFLIFLTGFTAQKLLQLHIKSISTLALYILVPALVFKTFYRTEFDLTYLYIAIYSLLLTVILIVIVQVISRLKKYPPSTETALILSTGFMNNGNYGAPVILFAFGETGFRYAIAIMILHTIVMSTIGIYYAARGKYSVKNALRSVMKMPIMHALIIALIWQKFQIPLPQNFEKIIDMVGNAAIPTIMLVLGMQLAEIKLKNIRWPELNLAIFLRLIMSPLIAAGLVWILPVETLLGKVMIVEAAMPASAIMTLYALQYESDPDLVSTITFVGTILSALTLTLLLNFIQ